MTPRTSHRPAAWLVALTFCLPLAVLAAGMATVSQDPTRPAPKEGFQVEQLAHASPDEYFFGIGNDNNDYVPEGVDAYACPSIDVPKITTTKVVVTNEIDSVIVVTTNNVVTTNMVPLIALPKVNQSYIWGLGKSENDIFFGTLANGNLLVMAVYLDTGETNANSTGSYSESGNRYSPEVSEGAASIYSQTHSGLGDWRPPQLFQYNLPSHSLTLLDPLLPVTAQYNLTTLAGIRAGGSATPNAYNTHRMVMLAGPPTDHANGGVGFFLFDATTTQYVGTTINYNYNNVRRMACINGDLYFGVQKPNTMDGAVIRWVNNPKAAGWPFIFQDVGTLDNMGADICIHEGRLFCTTWPGYVEGSTEEILKLLGTMTPTDLYMRSPGLWMSPVVPTSGLTTAHRTQWKKLWSIASYEPDQVISLTLGGGALASFDGYLYFGTMQVPGTGQLGFEFVYGLPTRPTIPPGRPTLPATGSPTEDFVAYTNAMIVYTNSEPYFAYVVSNTSYYAANSAISTNTTRPISIFRGRNFRTPVSYQGVLINLGGDFETLYGYEKTPVYVPANNNFAASNWVWTANKMGKAPSMGAAGFGDFRNVYTWTMEVFKHTLFVGTYDGSLPNGSKKAFGITATNASVTYGSDLWCLHSSQASSFKPVSRNGLGNICNYGFRTMASDSNGLYIGTANPRNMRPNPTNSPAAGGWELLKVTRRNMAPFDMDADFESDPAWLTTAGATFAVRSASVTVTNMAGATGVLAAWADFDGDGYADPAVCNPSTGAWTVWLTSRNNVKSTLTALASSGAVPVSADLDGDGKADQALCTGTTGKITWRSTMAAKTYAITPTASPAGKAYIPALGDYNGDGTAELVWYVPPVSATVTGRILRSSLTTAAKYTIANLPGSFKGVPVPADYDGDGKTDFALNNAATGLIRVWPSSGGAFFDSPEPGAGWLPMVGDYDGDGHADFAWYNSAAGTLRIQSMGDTDTLGAWGIPVGSRPVAAPAAVWYTK
ncbi:MAG: VCBS repeat-containing protein [bacterium]